MQDVPAPMGAQRIRLPLVSSLSPGPGSHPPRLLEEFEPYHTQRSSTHGYKNISWINGGELEYLLEGGDCQYGGEEEEGSAHDPPERFVWSPEAADDARGP